jgi:hypothetical protein
MASVDQKDSVMKNTKLKELQTVRKCSTKAHRDFRNNLIDSEQLRLIVQEMSQREAKLKEEVLAEALLSK